MRTAAFAVASATGTASSWSRISSRQPVDVDIDLPSGVTGSYRVRMLSEATGAQAVRDPDAFRGSGDSRPIRGHVALSLSAYAVATTREVDTHDPVTSWRVPARCGQPAERRATGTPTISLIEASMLSQSSTDFQSSRKIWVRAGDGLQCPVREWVASLPKGDG